MPSFPETTTSTVELADGAARGPAIGRVALIAPAGGSDLVAVNTVETYSAAGQAATRRGTGSKLAVGAKHVLGEGHADVVTIAVEQVEVTYTFGNSSAIKDGDVSDPLVGTGGAASNVPIASIVSATKDGSTINLATEVAYLADDQDPDSYDFVGNPTIKMAINMKTGEIELASNTTGSGQGLVLVFKRWKLTEAMEALGEEKFEYLVPAGYNFTKENWGIISGIIDAADDYNKMCAFALPSGASPTTYKAFLELTRNGRVSVFAAKSYTGDGTSAYAGYRAKYETHAQIKLQPAPRTLTYSGAGYTFTEYGGHKNPGTNTWSYIGVNAVFRHDGSYRMHASRSLTGITAKDRFDYVMRIVREVNEDCQAALNSLVVLNPSGNSVSQDGIDAGVRALRSKLQGYETRGKLTARGDSPAFDIRAPSIGDLTDAQVDNGEVELIEVDIRPTRQIGYWGLKLKVQ